MNTSPSFLYRQNENEFTEAPTVELQTEVVFSVRRCCGIESLDKREKKVYIFLGLLIFLLILPSSIDSCFNFAALFSH